MKGSKSMRFFKLLYVFSSFIFASINVEALASTKRNMDDEFHSHATPSKPVNKSVVVVLQKTSPDTVTERKSTGENPIERTTMQQEIIELSQSYISEGMPFADAMREAIKNVKALKYTPLEKRLIDLGCVKWDEIKEITPNTLATIENFYRPEKGNFILQPGLRIVYLNDIS